METTTDFILNHRVYLRQPLKGYRAGLDAVFLAASVPAQAGEEILDLGSGVGAAALAVLARVPGATGTGVEKVAEVAALARENAGLNHWADRLQVYADDLGAPTGPWADRVYDHVCANPPYYPAATFTQAAPGYKRAAHVETEGAPLALWVARAAALVKPGGTVTFIFPGDQEQRLYALFAQAFRQIDILPLLSFAPDTHPIRVVLQGWTSKEPARVHRHPGFVLHEESRTYTPAADAVLRAAQATVLGER